MDLATGVAAVEAAGQISTETFVYLQRTLPEVERNVAAVKRGRSEAEKMRAFRQIRNIVAPIVEHVLSQVEEVVRRIERAFDVEEIFPMGEDTWSAALMALDQNRRLLDQACDPFRREAQKTMAAKVLWPPEWSERYDAAVDAIEDYSETIALGLDPEIRTELLARLDCARQA